MKLLSLNLWGGRGGRDDILRYFRSTHDIDVFCLQEVWNGGRHMEGKMAGSFPIENIVWEIMGDIAEVLSEHDVYFRPHYGDWYGLAVFVKKDIPVIDEGERFVYKDRGFYMENNHGNCARNIQWIKIDTLNGPRCMINVHGLWNGNGKTDTPERLLQSDNIVSFLKELDCPFILTGDLNLRPDTESLRRLEAATSRNLIREFGISSTRSSHYKKPERFADYTLVSEGIEVRHFEVMPDEVSDHLPLRLEFE